ncbi:MAG: site-specific DNA-methyltransferase [archaeon]|nr:site-specific DNA-methyltransferase [archaeon]
MKTLSELNHWRESINEIMHCDCLELMKMIPDKSIDLVLTDPPYGITDCHWDTMPDLKNLWKEFLRIGKKNCAFVLTASQPFTTDLINSCRKFFKYVIVWDKKISGSFMLAKYRPLQITEDIVVFCREKTIYNPIMTIGRPRRKVVVISNTKSTMNYDGLKKTAERGGMGNKYYPTNLIKISNAYRLNKKHPTQKPLELFKYLVKTFSNENNLVLDPFAGSFTTARACKDLKRNFISCDLKEDYCKIGEQRMKQQLLF